MRTFWKILGDAFLGSVHLICVRCLQPMSGMQFNLHCQKHFYHRFNIHWKKCVFYSSSLCSPHPLPCLLIGSFPGEEGGRDLLGQEGQAAKRHIAISQLWSEHPHRVLTGKVCRLHNIKEAQSLSPDPPTDCDWLFKSLIHWRIPWWSSG